MRYNIAFIPDFRTVSDGFINFASWLVENLAISPSYLLKDPEKLSIPHLSIVQFELEGQQLLTTIMNEIRSLWQETVANLRSFSCLLPNTLSYSYGTSSHTNDKIWVAFELAKEDNQLIFDFHGEILTKLKPLRIKPVNKIGTKYTPHFTLCNYTRGTSDQRIYNIPLLYQDKFQSFTIHPVLGTANHCWELTSICYDSLKESYS